jgi:hypothetical protein
VYILKAPPQYASLSEAILTSTRREYYSFFDSGILLTLIDPVTQFRVTVTT